MTNTIDISKLTGIIPGSVIEQIPSIAELNNQLRMAHFLSQCGHESANFETVFENLNYSADSLAKLYGKYFDHGQSIAYSRNPQAIANRIYAGRMGNGNEASGEGWKFRGRGYIQLTGHDNYVAFSEFIGEDCVAKPDLVATKYPLHSADWFFNINHIWTICDKGASRTNIEAVTRKINGGINGLADRIKRFEEIYRQLLT